MLYVWTKKYPQVVGTCSGHHGQLISQNCVLTKIRAEPPPPPLRLKKSVRENLSKSGLRFKKSVRENLSKKVEFFHQNDRKMQLTVADKLKLFSYFSIQNKVIQQQHTYIIYDGCDDRLGEELL